MKLFNSKIKFPKTREPDIDLSQYPQKALIRRREHIDGVVSILVKNSKDYSQIDWREFYSRERRIVHIFAHNSPTAWLIVAPYVLQLGLDVGAYDRVVACTFHRQLWNVPYLAPLLEAYHGVRGGFKELFAAFESGEITDYAVFPEGDSTFFGNSVDIQPFKSPNFIELALKSNATILLHAFTGPEIWSKQIPVSKKVLKPLKRILPKSVSKAIEANQRINIPLLPRQIELLKYKSAVFKPNLKTEDLLSDRTALKNQLWPEANRARSELQQLVDDLKSSD